MIVRAKTRQSFMVDGARFGDVILGGGYYTVLDSSGEYYRLDGLGWFFKDGFEEVV